MKTKGQSLVYRPGLNNAKNIEAIYLQLAKYPNDQTRSVINQNSRLSKSKFTDKKIEGIQPQVSHSSTMAGTTLLNNRVSTIDTNSTLSSSAIQQYTLDTLVALNADTQVMYYHDLKKEPDFQMLDDKITALVRDIGFTRPDKKSYEYQGEDPAAALQALLQVRPLVLDCGSSTNLAKFAALFSSHRYCRLRQLDGCSH